MASLLPTLRVDCRSGQDVATFSVENCGTNLAELRRTFGGFPGLRRIIFEKPNVCGLRFDTAAHAQSAMESINAFM